MCGVRRDFRPTSLERGQEAWRLRVYMLYAWGGPLVLAGAAALLDQLPHAPDALLRPRFAVQRCWFYGDMEIFVYFFGPVGVLLLVNLALFVSTTRQLTCGLWRRDEVKSTSERSVTHCAYVSSIHSQYSFHLLLSLDYVY